MRRLFALAALACALAAPATPARAVVTDRGTAEPLAHTYSAPCVACNSLTLASTIRVPASGASLLERHRRGS